MTSAHDLRALFLSSRLKPRLRQRHESRPSMTRDYSHFLPPRPRDTGSHSELSPLQALGWQPFFAQQISADELTATPPVRVVEVHRNALHVVGDNIDTTLPPRQDVTVGDWLLLDQARLRSSQVLERASVIKRRAPGTERQEQLIAANIETAFIVTSCNQDFNIARLERYIAVTFEAEITPVIVLTKTDMIHDPHGYIEKAKEISEGVAVVALDAKSDEPKTKLADWCK